MSDITDCIVQETQFRMTAWTRYENSSLPPSVSDSVAAEHAGSADEASHLRYEHGGAFKGLRRAVVAEA